MQKSDAARIIAGLTPAETKQSSAPTSVHVMSGEVVGNSESGKVQIRMDGDVVSPDDDQIIEVDAIGGLEEGDTATILLTGQPGRAMTPMAMGSSGSVDRIVERIKTIEADYVKATEIEAEVGTFGYLKAADLEAEVAEFGYLKANELEAEVAEFGYLKADDLEAEVAEFGYLKANSATITDLQADTAKIHNLSANDISAATGYIHDLTSNNVTAQNIIADHGDFSTVKANAAKVANLTAQELEADHATIANLDTSYAQIDMANVNNAWIVNGLIKDAAIKSEMVESISANQLTAGEIDADEITVRNLRASSLTVQTADGYVYVGDKRIPTKEFIDSLKDELQNEIDGAIETFTVSAVPTLSNTPANDWVVSGDAEATRKLRAKHVGDIAYVVNSSSAQNGYCYRFAYDATNQEFKWVLIKDSDVTAALSRLSTAEGKITGLETFESNTTSWIEETDEGLETIRTNHTNLAGIVDKTVVETKQLWFTKANTTAPNKPTAAVTSTSTAGNAWRVVVPAWNASYPNYYYCLQYKLADGTYAWSDVVRDIAMGESQQQGRKGVADAATADGKAVSAQNTANANIKSSVQLWFTKANSTAPDKPSAQVTTNSASTANAWNLAIPTYNSSYPHYFYCYQQQKGDGTYQWSDVVYDRSVTEAQAKAQAALPSSAFTTFQSTTFKNLVDTVEEQSSTITSLSTKTETLANPNMEPYFAHGADNTDGYWKVALSSGSGNWTTQDDGWALLSKDNSSGTGYSYGNIRTKKNDLLKASTKYTALLEVRNLSVSSGTLMWCAFTPRSGTGQFATEVSMNISENGVYRQESTTRADMSGCTESTSGYIRIPAGASVTGEFRLSIYEGSYDGPYKPYVPIAEHYTTSNTVNSVKQTADSNRTYLTNLTTTLGTNADGTSKSEDIVHKYNTLDQTLDGTVTRVGKTEASLKTIGNPNLSPFFSMAPYRTATSYDGGYWQPTAQNWLMGGVTKLSDGWAHVTRGASTSLEVAIPRIESLSAGDKATLMVEWRNITVTGSPKLYARNYPENCQFNLNSYEATWNTSSATSGSRLIVMTVNSTATGDKTWNAAIDLGMSNGSGVRFDGDLRISLYEGDYDGPYKPYSGEQLYASQSELKITAEGITSTVEKISSYKYCETTYSYSLANIKTYSAEGYSGTWSVSQDYNLRIGDTIYLKVHDSTRNCDVYVKGTITAMSSATRITMASHGYEDILPVDTIKSTINQSADSVKIQANHVNIEGAAIFTGSGRLSSTSLNNAYDAKGAASTAETNAKAYTDSVEIGGRNLLLGTGAAKTSPAISLNSNNYATYDYYALCRPYHELFAEDDLLTLSFDWSCTATSGNFRIEAASGSPYVFGTVVSANGTRSSTSAYVDVTSTNTSGRVVIVFKATSATVATGDDYKWFRIRTDGTGWSGKTFTVSNAKMERGNKSTDWSPAPEDQTAYVDEFIDGIQVGGRNLYKSTTPSVKVGSGNASISAYDFAYHGRTVTVTSGAPGVRLSNIIPETNVPYTISFTCTASVACNIQIDVMDNAAQYVNVPAGTSKVAITSTPTRAVDSTYHFIDILFSAAGTYKLANIMVEQSNKASNWSPAPEDVDSSIAAAQSTANSAIKRSQRIYYRSSTDQPPTSMPTAWVTESGNKWASNRTTVANWTTKVTPISNGTGASVTKYLYLWTCLQYQLADNSAIQYSTVLLDDSTTVIDGGTIITGSLSANSINANSGTFNTANIPYLDASKINAGDIAAARIKTNVISAINSLTAGQIDAARIKVSEISIGQNQVTNLTSDLSAKAAQSDLTTEVNQRKATYGTCSTAAGTALKVVTCANFALTKGARIAVKFTTANTTDAPTLNVNSTASDGTPIWANNAVASSSNPIRWGANATLTFVYDGSAFVLEDKAPTYTVACSTAATTRDKAAAVTGALVINGTRVTLRFSTANTYVSNSVRVNFSSTGATNVYVDNAATSTTNTLLWDAGTSLTFVRQGAAWYLTERSDASKTATTYLTDGGSNGLMVHPSNDANTGVRITDKVDIKTANKIMNRIDTSGMTLYDGNGVADGNIVAKFASKLIELGKNAPDAIIRLCGGKLDLTYFHDTDTGIQYGSLYSQNYMRVLSGTDSPSGDAAYGSVSASRSQDHMSGGVSAGYKNGTTLKTSSLSANVAVSESETPNVSAHVYSGTTSSGTEASFKLDPSGFSINGSTPIKAIYADSTVVNLSNGKWLSLANATVVAQKLGSGASQGNTVCIAQNGGFESYTGVVTGAMGSDGSARAYIYPNHTGYIRINFILIRFA